MLELPMRHILFPYDFSRQGQLAARYVAAYAKRFDAHVTMLSVVPPGYAPVPASMGGSELHAGEHASEWRRTLKCRLDRALVEEFSDVDVERVADSGDAGLRIVDVAHNRDVDVVMMPTHGLGVFHTMLAGSVTARVMHDVRCPVWTAAHSESQHAPAMPRTVLCAVDATNEGVRLVQYAALFSKRVGAALSVLHVVEPVSDWPSLARERELLEAVRDTATQAIDSMLTSAGVQAATRIAVGGITERAADEARAENVDLVIVGRGVSREPFARLRTHVFGIVEQSPCPVLSV
jgi:nucleotide-binding universal stress UspA family protein